MSQSMQEVLLQRQALLAKIAVQRDQIARTGGRLKTPLAWADQAVGVVHYLRSHPMIWAVVAGLLVVRRSSVLAVPRMAWRLWKWYRSARSFTGKMLDRL